MLCNMLINSKLKNIKYVFFLSHTVLKNHCLGACLHQGIQFGVSRGQRNERLRFAPALGCSELWLLAWVWCFACPDCIAVGCQKSLAHPGTCTRTPASDTAWPALDGHLAKLNAYSWGTIARGTTEQGRRRSTPTRNIRLRTKVAVQCDQLGLVSIKSCPVRCVCNVLSIPCHATSSTEHKACRRPNVTTTSPVRGKSWRNVARSTRPICLTPKL